MRIRTTILAVAVALLPALAVAQTAAPDTGNATTAPSAGSNTTSPAAGTATRTHHHHSRAERQKRRAEVHQKVQQLSATDKAKYDEIGKQMRDLHQQRMQILGLKKS